MFPRMPESEPVAEEWLQEPVLTERMLRVPEEQTTERWQVPELAVAVEPLVAVEQPAVAVQPEEQFAAAVLADLVELPAVEERLVDRLGPIDPVEPTIVAIPAEQAAVEVRPEVDLEVPTVPEGQAAELVEVQSAAVERREPAVNIEPAVNSCTSVVSMLCSSGDCSCCTKFRESNRHCDHGHRHRQNQDRQQQKSSKRQQAEVCFVKKSWFRSLREWGLLSDLFWAYHPQRKFRMCVTQVFDFLDLFYKTRFCQCFY